MPRQTSNSNEKKSPFHEGEIAAQNRLGVAEKMEKFARKVVRPYMPDQHREFFAELPILYVGHVDEEGWPWATAVTGKPGFLKTPSKTTLQLDTIPIQSDPLFKGLENGRKLGFLGLEAHSRRRNRLNGFIKNVTEGGFEVSVDQSFGNCPQYIQTRNYNFVREPGAVGSLAARNDFLDIDEDTAAFIEGADTFFVSSSVASDPDDRTSGVDMSHRGGRPGFVKVEGNTLTIPDYTGNFHFNTLGNFLINPKAGLLFINYGTGDMLQMTGRVEILWEDPAYEHFQGAERAWTFTLERGMWLKDALPIRFEFGEMSLNSLLTGNWREAEAQKAADNLKNQWRNYKVVDAIEESNSVRSIYLQADDEAGLLSFKSGQFLTVQLPGVNSTTPLIRTYTLSSSPLDKSYRISVKRDGVASSFLHDELNVGDMLIARAPSGAFVFDPQEAKPAVLLAGGIGITPMVSMMRDALQDGFRNRNLRQVNLIHSAKSSGDRAFFEEIGELTRQAGGQFAYASLLSNIGVNEKLGVDYHAKGRVTEDFLRQLATETSAEYYLCGPASFMSSLYNLLRNLGVQDRDIHAEAFGPASLVRIPDEGQAQPSSTPAEEALVSFSKSGVELLWRKEDGNLLDFAEKHGLTPAYGCRNGACGSCAVSIKSGAVSYCDPPTAGPAEDQALLCCAKPEEGAGDLILDL